MEPDPVKHPHPRRYKRALSLLVLGLTMGAIMTLLGLYELGYHRSDSLAWTTSLVLLGPGLIFLSSVAYSTYLEKLEQQTHGGFYHELDAPTLPPTDPADKI